MQWITAGDGTAHVSSADDGAIYAGIVGTECYVSDIGDKLSCTMQSANTALIGTGLGILNGRWFRVTTPEEVTIESGTQNQRRNDIICAHFETSEDGKEGGGLVVVKGTPTSGTDAEDPEIPTGDILDGATDAYMPLWRIPIDGINAGDPEPLFSVLVPYADFRDSVSQVDTWDSSVIHAQRCGRVVTVYMEYPSTTMVSNYEYALTTLPERFRPPAERRVPAFVSDAPRACSAIYRPDGTGAFYVGSDCGGDGKHAMALWAWCV